MNRRKNPVRVTRLALALVFLTLPRTLSAQVTPAAGSTPPDDTPSIRVGATLYPNYTYQTDPKITDADGNVVNRNAFDVSRAYININGQVSHIVAFRITPDITRETNAASSLSGSLVFRVKYAFLQTNLDDWMTKGSWARFGIQQTPYLDFFEGIYRYRFQGTTFTERAGYQASSDAGVSFHYNMPSNYGEVHVGLYNGETYTKAEVNDQKAIMVRVSVRPFAAKAPVLRGLRAHLFYIGDNYLKHGERKRTVVSATYEHPSLVAGFEFLDARDQRSGLPGTPDVASHGFSVFVTPRTKQGWEGLFRYDYMVPNSSSDFAPFTTAGNATTTFDSQRQNRVIVGGAYWFPHQGNVSTALLIDYDAQVFKNLTAVPTKAVGVHGLINF